METLRSQLRAAAEWIDGRALRERALLGAAALCVMVGAWTVFWIDPLAARRAELHQERESVQAEIGEIEAQGQEILARHATDPNEALRERREQLLEQIGALDERIREHTVTMISPAEMARFLETLLMEDVELRLVRLENLGAEPMLEGATEDAAEAPRTGVFKHTFEVVLDGSYLSTLRYLHALEALPWNFFWDALEYEVEEYPRGRATIRAYTLSAEEGWIGA